MFNLANLLTAANLVFGSIAVVQLTQGQEEKAILFILMAAIVDFADGFVARKLNQVSKFGAELDSLSDMVSFGLNPALMALGLLMHAGTSETVAFLGLILAVAAAFRLARFNISSSGSDNYFTGLPVPANALFFCGLLNFHKANYFLASWNLNPIVILIIIVAFSYLMISEIKILKIHLTRNWLNKYGIVLFIELLILISIYWIGLFALSLLIIVHILLSIFFNYRNQKTLT